MLMEIVFDARDADSKLGTYMSLSTAWSLVDKGEMMLRKLKDFPKFWKPFST